MEIDFDYETILEAKNFAYETNDKTIMDRYRRFLSLSNIGKNLIILLYKKDLKAYLQSFSHPLEDYIVQFDRMLDDEDTVIAIASRIGILISDNSEFSAREIFIDRIVSYITNVEHNTRKVTVDKFPSTADIIQMSKDEFKNYAKIYGFEYNYLNYLDRMNFFAEIYISNLEPNE